MKASTFLRTTFTLTILFLQACTYSQDSGKNTKSNQTDSGSTNTSTPTTAAIHFNITSVVVASSGTPPDATLYFSAGSTDPHVSDYCIAQSGSTASSKPCSCKYTWIEQNYSSNTTINRSVSTPVTLAQTGVAKCGTPPAWSSGEIPNNTTLQVALVPGSSNTSSFDSNTFNFTKTVTTTLASFQADQYGAFNDVLRYTCYDQTIKPTVLSNKRKQLTSDPSTGTTVDLYYANRFCTGTSAEVSSGNCPGNPGPQMSSQSYYYNLYIRNTAVGSINAANANYRCPRVREALFGGATGSYYPLDSNFALALEPVGNFNIGVEAYTKVGVQTDPNSVNTSCDPNKASTPSDGKSLVAGCLGFAAKPNTDGSCPMIRVGGVLRNTYRLRKYFALYPHHFQANGKLFDPNALQPRDVIFVLDRPVTGSSDPLKPFTMLGPKPCPFAFFDKKGVTEAGSLIVAPTGFHYDGPIPETYKRFVLSDHAPAYVGTNNARWNGKNVDGTHFPNVDNLHENSCSTTMSIRDPLTDQWSVTTLNRGNLNPIYNQNVYVRPIDAWLPKYLEDTSFVACAPESSVKRDPPLHLYTNTTTLNTAYCSEVYPTQNPYVSLLEPGSAYLTYHEVKPYTSHSASTCSTIDYDSLLPAPYLTYAPTGKARKSQKTNELCERTIVSQNPLPPMPLLAPEEDVRDALANDSQFECRVTYDDTGTKKDLKSPQRCCQNITDYNSNTTPTGPTGKHLEHGNTATSPTSCLIPIY